jgi:hypothetical protein
MAAVGVLTRRTGVRPDALLAVLADPDRGFDAVVVGEYERSPAEPNAQRSASLSTTIALP